jgi:AcrR family transcriptional regulator
VPTKPRPKAPATPSPTAAGGRRPRATGHPPTPGGTLELRRQPRQERALQTIHAVLQAAGAEIAEGGLDRLTTKRIAAAAGLSVGAVYEYFPNKETIVSELLKGWLARVYKAIDSVHPRHGQQLDLLNYLNLQVDQAAPVYEDQPGLGALFNMIDAMPALRAVIEQHDDAVVDSVASALRALVPQADPAEVATAARCIPIICHQLLSTAIVYRLGEQERLIKYLRVCLMAIASRLLTA